MYLLIVPQHYLTIFVPLCMCVKLKDVEGKLVSALYPILRDKRDIPIKGFHLFFIIGINHDIDSGSKKTLLDGTNTSIHG